MSPRESESQRKIEQLEVGRHFKMKADGVKFDIHSGGDYIGVWLSGPAPAENVLGLFMRKGESPFIQLHAPKSLGYNLPFAFGGGGLQIPKQGGGVVVIPLAELSKMAMRWEAQQKGAANEVLGADDSNPACTVDVHTAG